jgi:hypothetical protein
MQEISVQETTTDHRSSKYKWDLEEKGSFCVQGQRARAQFHHATAGVRAVYEKKCN